MKVLLASIFTLALLSAGAASADGVGVGANVGNNGVGVGAHVGNVGAGVGIHVSAHPRHCSSWRWHHYHDNRYCSRWYNG